MSNLDLLVTLWPSFPHFASFVGDPRIAGVRLNSAMMSHPELDAELAIVRAAAPTTPLYFDVKGRQLRVVEILDNKEYLDIRLNHPIRVHTPTVVLLKAGADAGLLGSVSEDGYRLTFQANPRYRVRAGESLHIRHPSLEVGGPLFTTAEAEKIEKVRASGLIDRWFLSYVEEPGDVDALREIVGPSAELMLKIESKRGMTYVEEHYRKQDGVRLVAACGDLYVEVDHPHQILRALETIISKDPEACVGSRMMLSVIHEEVPSLADFAHLAWLHSVGYRSMMLCDELCLKGSLLSTAVAAFESFRQDRLGHTSR